MNRKKYYKESSFNYWNNEYATNGWRVVHNAGSFEKTEKLAEREIDLFLYPTKEKCLNLLNDKENNPYPTFWEDYDLHPSIDELQIERGRALDYGCGWMARYSIALAKYFDSVVGVDISSNAILMGKENVKSKKLENKVKLMMCSGTELQFPSNYFDFIFSNLVLQHIGNKEVILNLTKEFARCLKPGAAARLEYLDSSQHRPDEFESVVEGNGVAINELKSSFSQFNCEIVSYTDKHPYLWVTARKKKVE